MTIWQSFFFCIIGFFNPFIIFLNVSIINFIKINFANVVKKSTNSYSFIRNVRLVIFAIFFNYVFQKTLILNLQKVFPFARFHNRKEVFSWKTLLAAPLPHTQTSVLNAPLPSASITPRVRITVLLTKFRSALTKKIPPFPPAPTVTPSHPSRQPNTF